MLKRFATRSTNRHPGTIASISISPMTLCCSSILLFNETAQDAVKAMLEVWPRRLDKDLFALTISNLVAHEPQLGLNLLCCWWNKLGVLSE